MVNKVVSIAAYIYESNWAGAVYTIWEVSVDWQELIILHHIMPSSVLENGSEKNLKSPKFRFFKVYLFFGQILYKPY